MSLFISCIFNFVAQIRKTCYRQKKLSLWSLLNGQPSSWFPLFESLKMTCTSYAWFLNFLTNGKGLGCFSQSGVLPRTNKIAVTWPYSVWNERVGSILIYPKSAKWLSILKCQKLQNHLFENLHISCHWEARNIRFEQKVNVIQRVLLGTLPKVVTSLRHNNVRNLSTSSDRGATVIKFGQQKQLFDRSP